MLFVLLIVQRYKNPSMYANMHTPILRYFIQKQMIKSGVILYSLYLLYYFDCLVI